MKVTGIIAEYNPFHRGHEYQLAEARRMTGADYIIVVMSGCFTQRGTPAVLDKYDRARMALSCGADLVLELPVRFSCASAEKAPASRSRHVQRAVRRRYRLIGKNPFD